MLVLTAILRLPSFFEPVWYGDEGIYLTLGQALRRGAMLYRDIWDNKPPLLYYFYALAGGLFWARIAVLLFSLATLIILYKLGKILLDRRAALLAALLFSLLTSLPFLEGNTANGELFMIAPTAAAVYIILTAQKLRRFFLAGLFFSLGFLIKVPVIFDVVGIFLYLFYTGEANWRSLFSKFIVFSAGFVAPLLIVFCYYSSSGAFGDFKTAVLSQNTNYVAWKNTFLFGQGLIFLKILATLVISAVIIFVGHKTNNLKSKNLLPWLWLIWSVNGAMLGGRNYLHYLLQIVPPLTLVIASSFTLSKKGGFLNILAGAVLMVVLFKTQFQAGFSLPVVPYYQNFINYEINHKSQYDYEKWFDQKTPFNYRAADFLKKNSRFNETIFVWGDESAIYAISGVKPASRFIAAHHVDALDFARDEIIHSFKISPPKFIVIIEPVKFSFPNLETLLAEKYHLISKDGNILIYEIESQVFQKNIF